MVVPLWLTPPLSIMWDFHKPEIALSVLPNSDEWICPVFIILYYWLYNTFDRWTLIVLCVTEEEKKKKKSISNLSCLISNNQRWEEAQGRKIEPLELGMRKWSIQGRAHSFPDMFWVDVLNIYYWTSTILNICCLNIE